MVKPEWEALFVNDSLGYFYRLSKSHKGHYTCRMSTILPYVLERGGEDKATERDIANLHRDHLTKITLLNW